MTTPLQVLERQHGFLLKWEHEQDFRTYVNGCFSSEMAWSEEDAKIGNRYVDACVQSFRMADAYRVSEDMCDLVTFAASRLDDTDKWDRDLAPSPFGFVVFEKPLPIWDVRGELMLANYLTWGPIGVEDRRPLTGEKYLRAGTWMTMWNDPKRNPDEPYDRWIAGLSGGRRKDVAHSIKMMGHYAFIGSQAEVDGHPLGPMTRAVTPEVLARMEGDDTRYREMGLVAPPVSGEFTNPARYLHALWLLLGQTVADVREERLSRAASKVVGRMQIPGQVTVVQLRRRAGRPSQGESHVQWQHRWMVRGHWRWQPYGDGTTRRIWINPFVKGPEDAPFKQSEKVYNLSR